MSTIAVFPGQGAQKPGMGKELYDTFDAARLVFDEVDDALGERLSDVIFNGPEDQLTLTQNAQPALMACSLAAVRASEQVLDKKLHEFADMVAGHSLGEYSALAAVGAVNVGDAARLLRLRGTAMQRAVPAGDGAMAAIMGLDVERIDAMLAGLDAGVVTLANDNSDGQAVISGSKSAVEAAAQAAREAGAKRALMLDVSAPFHCPLMQPAADELAPALQSIAWAPMTIPVISNVEAAFNPDKARIAELLTTQVCGRVRWRESMETMKASGVDRMIEFGPGKVLTGLARRTLKGADLINISAPADIETFAATIGLNPTTAPENNQCFS